jgi:hypothetical protein
MLKMATGLNSAEQAESPRASAAAARVRVFMAVS